MDTTLQDPLVGRLLEDRYLVLERIDHGGMATVYHALDQRLDRDVALKVLHAHLAGDEAFAARFVREARSAARLSHPNVVGVYDQGQDGDLLFLAMEYLPGRTLRQVLVERGALTPKETFRVMEPVLDALAAAHRAGIVHRDVKPENVILTDDGRVKVADFGLARAATSNATSGVLLGTVAYLAPETVLHGSADARSDVYAAGVMLFELLTGRQPFVGEVPAQVAYKHVHEDVPAPSDVAGSVPGPLDDVVLAATARDPGERPDDAAALLTLLRGAKTRVAPRELDARADVAALGAAAGAGAVAGLAGQDDDPYADLAATQAVGTFGEPAANGNRTQALPGLANGTLLGGPDVPPVVAAAPPAPGGRRRLVPSALPVNEDGGVPIDDAQYARLAEQRRRRGLAIMAAVIATALVLVIGVYWFLAGPGARVVVPPTATLTQSEAEKVLANVGLTAEITTANSETVKKGVVIESRPEAGDTVQQEGTVELVVSLGPPLVEIPDVAGSEIRAAEEILDGQGFAVGTVKREFSDTVPDGVVIRTDPKAGTERPKGSKVGLVVSKGEAPIEVPDVRNLPQDQAEDRLIEAGFRPVVAENREDSDTVPEGSVVSQSPAPGEKVARDSEVTLVISDGGGDLERVPNVFGRKVEDAIDEIEDRGFVVNITGNTGGDPDRQRVVRQDPLPFTQLPEGATVTIEVQEIFG